MKARVSIVIATAFALALVAPVTALGTKTHAVVVGCKGDSGSQAAKTAHYHYVLRVGSGELMYTPAQVKKMHPKSGEVMLRGQMNGMSGMPGMSMDASTRHLEVQICTRPRNTVITAANPTITMKDKSSRGIAMKVPVAVMEGVGAGTADLHYGNNVTMKRGHRYTVTVTVKRETATFRVKTPTK
jgi:hypothetical protein